MFRSIIKGIKRFIQNMSIKTFSAFYKIISWTFTNGFINFNTSLSVHWGNKPIWTELASSFWILYFAIRQRIVYRNTGRWGVIKIFRTYKTRIWWRIKQAIFYLCSNCYTFCSCLIIKKFFLTLITISTYPNNRTIFNYFFLTFLFISKNEILRKVANNTGFIISSFKTSFLKI